MEPMSDKTGQAILKKLEGIELLQQQSQQELKNLFDNYLRTDGRKILIEIITTQIQQQSSVRFNDNMSESR